MPTPIHELWKRLETVALKQGSSLDLAPPASEEDVAAAEAKLGLKFPADFRQSLLLHDGQTSYKKDLNRPVEWMPGCPALHPLKSLVGQWEEEQGLADDMPPPDETEIEDRLKAGTYRKGRIPIAGTPYWDGDKTYLDMDPGPAGTAGQLITMTSECDFVILDDSFAAALERWVEAKEQDTFSEEGGHPSEAFARYKHDVVEDEGADEEKEDADGE